MFTTSQLSFDQEARHLNSVDYSLLCSATTPSGVSWLSTLALSFLLNSCIFAHFVGHHSFPISPPKSARWGKRQIMSNHLVTIRMAGKINRKSQRLTGRSRQFTSWKALVRTCLPLLLLKVSSRIYDLCGGTTYWQFEMALRWRKSIYQPSHFWEDTSYPKANSTTRKAALCIEQRQLEPSPLEYRHSNSR